MPDGATRKINDRASVNRAKENACWVAMVGDFSEIFSIQLRVCCFTKTPLYGSFSKIHQHYSTRKKVNQKNILFRSSVKKN